MSTFEDALAFIVTADKEQAKKISDAAIDRIKWHIQVENINVRASLSRGAKVSWKTEKHGYPQRKTGKVLQVNTSTAKIRADDGQTWRVALTLLQVEP
jgi:hypothetical protein